MSGTVAQSGYAQLPLRRESDDAAALGPAAWLLLIVLAVAAIVAALWRRRASTLGSSSSASVRAGRVTPLTAQASVHVVEWEGERLLVACTPHSVTLLARRPTDPVVGGGDE